LNAVKIRDGAKMPAMKDVDAVLEVWGPANETATSFCVTETRVCKCGPVAGDPAPVRYIAMPRRATSPVFAVPSECEGCGAKDAFVSAVHGDPQVVSVYVQRVMGEDKPPSRRAFAMRESVVFNGTSYELVATMHHSGSAKSGHWHAMSKCAKGWKKVDDGKESLP
jgi:hypothetical protein